MDTLPDTDFHYFTAGKITNNNPFSGNGFPLNISE
jgi:hypothetical protein